MISARFEKAPGFEENLLHSFAEFANAQPEAAGFVVLFILAACAKVGASLIG